MARSTSPGAARASWTRVSPSASSRCHRLRPRRGWVGALPGVAALALLFGCGDEGSGSAGDIGGRRVDTIVATVDGEPIGAAEVLALMREGATREEALDARVRERLLAEEATRRGYAARADAHAEGQRALARALLEQIESEHPLRTATRAEARARFDELRGQHERPETRAGSVVRIELPAGADAGRRARGQRVAETLRRELGRDPAGTLRALGAESVREGLRVHVETLRASPRSELPPAIGAALFELPSPGVAPELLSADDGLRLVVLSRVVPGITLDFEEHEASIREQLVTERRRAALDRIVEDGDGQIDEAVASEAVQLPLEGRL